MNDDSQNSTASLVELSKLLHTHDWPGDISLLIGSFLDETVIRIELYEMGPPPPPPKLATGSVGKGLGGPALAHRSVLPEPRPPPNRGQRLYEKTQPFYAGVTFGAWPPSFEVDASVVEACGAGSPEEHKHVILAITAIGPRGASKFAEEFFAMADGPVRGELYLKVTNWVCSHFESHDNEFPVVQVETFAGDATEPVPRWRRTSRRSAPMSPDEHPPALTGPVRLVVTLHVNESTEAYQLPKITTCGTKELDRTDSRFLLEGAISYRGEALSNRYGNRAIRNAQYRPKPTLGPDDFPQFRLEITCGNVWLADATFPMTVDEGPFGVRARCVVENIHLGEEAMTFGNEWHPRLECRIHALRGNKICWLYEDVYCRSGEDPYPETSIIFGREIFPLVVPPHFCVHSRRSEVAELCCRPTFSGEGDAKRLILEFLVSCSDYGPYECEHPHEILCYFDHARWGTICKERWWGDVRIASGEIVENGSFQIDYDGAREILRERYHMDLAPDASWLAGHTFERPRLHFAGEDSDY